MSTLWFFIALTSSLLSSCFFSKTEPPPLTLNIAIHDDPILTPEQAKKALDLSVSKLLFEGLTRENQNREDLLELALAQHYSSDEEDKIFSFHLKENALWSDGTPITAQDVLTSWEHSKAHTMHIEIFQGLSFHAPSTTTITVISDSPNPDLPKLLAFPAFAIYKPENPQVYSGPFVLKRHSPGRSLLFTKNPYYYDFNVVPLNSIQLEVLPDIFTAKHLMTRNKIHWVGQPWHQGIPKELKTHNEPLYHSYPIEGVFWLSLNSKAPQLSRFIDRHRIAAAINKPMLIQEALEGDQQPANSLSKHSKQQLFHDAHPHSSNQERLTLTYPAEIFRCQRIAEVLKEQLKTAGILLHLEGLEYHCFINKRNLYDYAIATQTGTAYYPNARILQNEKQKLLNIEIIPLYHMHYDYLASAPIKNILYNASGAVDLKYASLD